MTSEDPSPVDLQALVGKQGSTGQRPADEKQLKEDAAREEAARNAILSQVLDRNARARLANIAVAKSEKARKIENMIIGMARYGQISGKLSDDQLKHLLDRVTDEVQESPVSVKFDRRKAAFDLDDEDFY